MPFKPQPTSKRRRQIHLDRCRTQLKLVERIEAHEAEMNAFVRKVRKRKH